LCLGLIEIVPPYMRVMAIMQVTQEEKENKCRIFLKYCSKETIKKSRKVTQNGKNKKASSRLHLP